MSCPKIIHLVHFGPPPSEEVWANIESASRVNPRWSRMLWTEETLHIFGLDFIHRLLRLPNYAARSNLARLYILQRFGGIYIDTDCECLRPMEEIGDYAAFAATQDAEGRICNAVMGCEPDHPWINWMVNHWSDYDQKDAAAGVYLATDAPRDYFSLIPRHIFYPYHWDDPAEKRVAHTESVVMHKWAGSWRK